MKDFFLYSTVLNIHNVHWNFSGGLRENHRMEVAEILLLKQNTIKKNMEEFTRPFKSL
jgi:hypothetical protein